MSTQREVNLGSLPPCLAQGQGTGLLAGSRDLGRISHENQPALSLPGLELSGLQLVGDTGALVGVESGRAVQDGVGFVGFFTPRYSSLKQKGVMYWMGASISSNVSQLTLSAG